MNTAHHCNCCKSVVHPAAAVRPVEGKAGGCVAGLALGSASKDPWIALGMAVLGTIIGHWIDTEVSPRCPTCGTVLRALLPHVFAL